MMEMNINNIYFCGKDDSVLKALTSINENIAIISPNYFADTTKSIIIFDDIPNNFCIHESNENSILIIAKPEHSKEILDLSEKHSFNLVNSSALNNPECLKTHLNIIERKHNLLISLYEKSESLEDKIFDLAFATTDVLEKKEEMEMLATKDSLTHLYNHSFFKEKMFEELTRSQMKPNNFSIAILDLDHFKSVNDTYGHLAGDKVIKNFAHIIAENIRPIDIPARYGGEEFAIIFTDANSKLANEIIDKIRTIFNEIVFKTCNKKFQVTFSAGITEFTPEFKDINAMIQIADEALYDSKSSGRNCSKTYNYID